MPHLASENLVLDGSADESVWAQAQEINLVYEVEPANNARAAVKTVARLFEDGNALYVAITAVDPAPDRIRAYLRDRDNINDGDWVAIRLDTFNDERRAFEFRVNPLGIQADIKIDETDSGANDSWDAIWFSKGQLNETGYSVEMKIPFSVLRFKQGEGIKTWGVQLLRAWPREIAYRFSNVAIQRDRGCEICQYAKMKGLASSATASSWAVVPSLTAITNEQRNPGESWPGGDPETDAGLDVRWSPNQNSVLNLTLNPDYSQIEADTLQLKVNNVNALFLKEKRSFFLDGADYFNSWSRLIYTRLFTRPNYGVKFTGKYGQHRIGLYQLEDENTYFLIPGSQRSRIVRLNGFASQNTGLRYRYELGELGNLGTTLTKRTAEGYDSRLVGVDGKVWFSESDYLRFQGMNSSTNYPALVVQNYAQDQAIDGNAYSYTYNHENDNDRFFVKRHYFGEDFRADSGFITRGNWTQDTAGASKTWHADDKESWWSSFTLYADWWRNKQVSDGAYLNQNNDLHLKLTGIYESELNLQLRQGKEFFGGQMFEIQNGTLFGEFTPLSGLSLYLEYAGGDAIDYENVQPATESTQIIEASWQVSDAINLQVSYTRQRFDVAAGELFTEQLFDTRLTWQFDSRQSLRLILQSDKETLGIGTGLYAPGNLSFSQSRGNQLLYSYKINPLSLFYLGYSDSGFKDELQTEFFKDSRTFFAKISWAWQS